VLFAPIRVVSFQETSTPSLFAMVQPYPLRHLDNGLPRDYSCLRKPFQLTAGNFNLVAALVVIKPLAMLLFPMNTKHRQQETTQDGNGNMQ